MGFEILCYIHNMIPSEAFLTAKVYLTIRGKA